MDKNPADPNVPIRDNVKRITKYRFEDMEDAKGSFDTKTDMLDALLVEKNVPKEYAADLNEYIVVKKKG